MNDEQFTPDEMNIIEQLKATPRPKINPSTAQAIRQQMMNELRTAAQPPRISRVPSTHLAIQLVAALVAALIVVGVLLSVIGNPSSGTTVTPPPTDQVALLLSQTPTTLPTEITTVQETSAVTPSPTLHGAVPSATPTTAASSAPPPSATLQTLVVIEGPITSIADNVITISNFSIQVEPDHPILKIVDVGDVVRAEGTFDANGLVAANLVSNIPETAVVSAGGVPTVGLDGPVEAINGNIVTVNDIPVEFAPDDPVLTTLQVGNFVSVQGNFSGTGTTIVLLVVNVAVFNTPAAVETYCWYDPGMGMGDDGMGMGDDAMGMGHWHCDGMGMGMGDDAMGMGDDGMGMGDDAMGAPAPP